MKFQTTIWQANHWNLPLPRQLFGKFSNTDDNTMNSVFRLRCTGAQILTCDIYPCSVICICFDRQIAGNKQMKNEHWYNAIIIHAIIPFWCVTSDRKRNKQSTLLANTFDSFTNFTEITDAELIEENKKLKNHILHSPKSPLTKFISILWFSPSKYCFH